ncbi:DUF4407 domain-containing protein [Phaeodactylibacter sp.]|jgi:hypothetical protein|uniref:DUF4407 domain-containing protein n=1 Tax=Phaeodactylibacter sp. TaxID=1940289 RepID=UPI0025EE1F7F|nr:DUF4407 domain-containing protein [Phaeodactylibacter sp.]MCI4650456.1 DUF4407 domain-containing protein [Phaeodactylibacter sp.]MCI5093830.1 DUF4407 domain-containing protein [Phaeodactylibacter sp.]
MSKVKQFLLYCSGADTAILEKCPTDENKFIGIGGTVLFTGLLAFFSAGYAVYTVFDNYFFAFVFGLIWGLMIFNLDRYIVASMKKRGTFWKDFAIAFPRLLMAVLLALVISKPLELKIFEKEINAELLVMEQEVFKDQEATIQDRYQSSIQAHLDRIQGLQTEINTQAAIRDTLALMALKEADGTGGSGNKNLGPIYRAKKADADKAEAELQTIKMRALPLIAEQEAAVTELDSMMKADIAGLERGAYGGMAARMEALHRLGSESDAIYWASIFIMLLFIAVETAPIFVKLISPRSPYDYLLYNYEHEFEMDNLEKVSLRNNAIKNKVRFDTETSLYRTQQEIKIEKELTNTYLRRKKEAIEQTPVEWERPPFLREAS